MPHINIKHFQVELSAAQKTELVQALSSIVQQTFACPDGAISIALEPVAPEEWRQRVYHPEVELRKELLCKTPNY
ncbi:MAG: tautomerase family protein [Pseudomonadota bacterium]